MYRLGRSILTGQPQVRLAFQARGIRDYCMASVGMPPHEVCTQVFVMNDGRVMPSDGALVQRIAQELERGTL